ncbi:MAG: replication initiator protein A [Thermanaeromonas sp.]|uniref:replication initiator protein A n=1 Tax=Thermanaeromonas sp. TaxID=2003697 RepID=UPI002439D35D|nr:replication initiator protein A [Thermanaeromonas sp.]MCG0278634.1 replication initiator protein A [Thermanaeromonas sp.]
MGEYFKVNEVNPIRFVMVPKVLLKNQKYKGLSLGAKLAYGLLLDRMELSKKNGWYDDEGRVYIK